MADYEDQAAIDTMRDDHAVWTTRRGNFENQMCWDTEGYWIVSNGDGKYVLCDLELSEIPGCSPVLGVFDTLDAAFKRHADIVRKAA